jgi:hypothetical protein
LLRLISTDQLRYFITVQIEAVTSGFGCKGNRSGLSIDVLSFLAEMTVAESAHQPAEIVAADACQVLMIA